MRTGRMMYRVWLERPVNENNRRGVKSTFEQVKQVWASIRPIKTTDADRSQKLVIGQYEIRIWTVEDLDETWRIVHNDHIYHITQADEPAYVTRETIIIANRDKLREKKDVH